MITHTVRFLPADISVTVKDGASLLDAAHKAGINVNAHCGGHGTCGKCKMFADGVEVLACKTAVHGNITAYISEEAGHKILAEGAGREALADPVIQRVTLNIEKPTLTDVRSLWKRTAAAIETESGIAAAAGLGVISLLHEKLTSLEYCADAVLCGGKLLNIVSPKSKLYGMAFDIGTTTVVGYLMDIANAQELCVVSALNPQAKYGADVISRANYALNGGLGEVTSSIRLELNRLIARAAAEASIDAADIAFAAIAGNTCMHHLLAGLSPETLVKAPYTPVLGECITVDASELGLKACPHAAVALLPNIAGFVGSDTVCAILSSGMYEQEDITLLIDIGTNGELVLGNSNRLIACSTAAGPAFEGCNISCGMRGAEGAIDHVRFTEEKIEYTVIGGRKPEGVCGSGLIDAVAGLLGAGVIDETGLFEEDGGGYGEYITQIDGMKGFMICSGVYITQRDIREVQLAKGAIAAGIRLLAKALNVELQSISKVYLAGAFGSYIRPESACGIKLIPNELISRIIPIGNAAGQGAKLCTINKEELNKAQHIANTCGYLELASLPEFQDVFVDELGF